MSANAILIANHTDKSLIQDTKKSTSDYRAYDLFLRVSLEGFTLNVYDKDKNKHLALKSYLMQEVKDFDELCQELHALFVKEELLQRYYPNVKVLFEGQKNTLIPYPLFDINELSNYLRFNHPLRQKEEISYDDLQNLEAYHVYAVPVPLKNFLANKFTRFKIQNYISSLIEILLINNKNQRLENTAFVNVRNSFFDIIHIEGNKLLLANSFRYRTREDFAYYLLYVLHQSGLNPEDVRVIFMGEIDKNSNLYEISYQYIRNIEFIARNDFFRYSYVFDDVPVGYYYNLLNTGLCE
ncbi:MAG: DUF3822 family protein [Bacteroidales bacterium]|nr:DUF3822 family protein [Bacteroidales bacterium]MCF8398192.1 DUF3822 family protein [Bacteroidales bacterium]